ncbi:MAG: penicillin-binding protein activator [bacterium]
MIVFITLLSGCGPEPDLIKQPIDNIERAEQALQNNQAELAAEFYLRAAREHPEDRVKYYLKAIDTLIAAGLLEQASNKLNMLNYQDLDQNQRLWADLSWAKLFLAQGAYSDALALLSIPSVEMPNNYWVKVWEIKGLSLMSLDDDENAALNFSRAAAISDDPITQSRLDQLTFSALGPQTDDVLNTLAKRSDSNLRLKGWVELIQLMRKNIRNNLPADTNVNIWHSKFSQLEYNPDIFQQFEQDFINRFEHITQIAVLLPIETRYKQAAQAILDGILNGYFQLDATVDIRVYSTTENPEDALTAYNTALNEGAQWIIGPLLKQNVEVILQQDSLAVPTLVLNRSSLTALHKNAFSIALDPESNAENMARFISEDLKLHRIAVIAPADDWGRRSAKSLISSLDPISSTAIQSTYYNPGSVDFSRQLRSLFQLNKSVMRHKRLERLLNSDLGFEVQRRADIDGMAIISKSAASHLLIPQIKFQHGVGLSLVAMPDMYSGFVDTTRDKDLNDVYICDSPWLFDHKIFGQNQSDLAKIFNSSNNKNSRLFALGTDSFAILPTIRWLSQHAEESLSAATGQLSIDDSGTIQRLLSCGQFKNSKLSLLAD